jgi:hypothetical protein
MRLRASALAMVFLPAFLAAAPALAQSDAALRDALDRFQEGLEAAAAANQKNDMAKWEEARVKFLEAYAVVRRPSLVYNLAYSEERLGRAQDAIGHYREYLATSDKPKEAEARTRLAALLQGFGQIKIEAPADAVLEVDGKATPTRAPLADTVVVTPGKHHVVARLADKTAEGDAEVTAGHTAAVSLAWPELKKKPSTAKLVTVGGLGVLGVAGLVTAGVLQASAGSKASRQKELQEGYPVDSCTTNPGDPRCVELQSVTDARHSNSVGAGVALGLGLGFVGATVATWFLWPDQAVPADSSKPAPAGATHATSPAPSHFTMRVAPTLQGFLAFGTF